MTESNKRNRVLDFVVAGTQKSATTWLYECLNEHPQVWVPRIKELHFFCPEGVCPKSRRAQGLDWYREQFQYEDRYEVRGELSVDYMYFPGIAEELASLNPELKVIFILRDPVDRAYSAYWMGRRNMVDYPPFADFLRPDSDVVARGFYHQQIERYRALFPDRQILILIYEDIARDPQAFIARVFRFLEVDEGIVPSAVTQVIGETKAMSPRFSRLFYRYAAKALKIPFVLWGWRVFKRVTGIKRAKSGEERASKYVPMQASERESLARIYSEENEKLFALIDRRIATWTSEAARERT